MSEEVVPRIVQSGDVGDCLASLLIARHLGKAEMVLTQGPSPQRQFKTLAHMLLPLIEAQPYISAAMWMDAPVGTTHELIHWRRPFYKQTRSLAESQAEAVGIKLTDFSPWLSNVEPSPDSAGRVIVSRSPRYQNKSFPWRVVAAKYKNAMMFIGLPDEHASLQRITGRPIEHRKIKDYMEVASLVKGSRLLISNQTGISWIGMGLGHPLVQECEMTRRIHDAQIPRANAIYYQGGVLNLP